MFIHQKSNFGLLNHSVNVITFGLARSDPIKRRTLYLKNRIRAFKVCFLKFFTFILFKAVFMAKKENSTMYYILTR